jgi:2-polyprenyl-3-methyl-5-hydroxy-6-metoxy-1,4-benzoquinol methylase
MIVIMRLSLRGTTPAEWLALRLGIVPVAAAEAWGGMALSGMIIAAVRTGMAARLAEGWWTAKDLSADLGLDPVPAQLLLEGLRSAGHVRAKAGRYALTRPGRRWLAPQSASSVAAFVAGASDYWNWWAELDTIARDGRPVGHHDAPLGDPYWRRYVLSQLDLARLSAAEVARKVPLRRGARSVLDVGGGHGWYAAELCRRHPGLSATVLDLPASAAIGREVIAASGMAGQVRHVDADARTADLGAGHDAVLCFNLVHHLSAGDVGALFARAHAALAPGGMLAVLDVFTGSARRVPAHASALALFTYLSSGSHVYSAADLHRWLREAGFAGSPRKVRVLRIPGQALYMVGK